MQSTDGYDLVATYKDDLGLMAAAKDASAAKDCDVTSRFDFFSAEDSVHASGKNGRARPLLQLLRSPGTTATDK